MLNRKCLLTKVLFGPRIRNAPFWMVLHLCLEQDSRASPDHPTYNISHQAGLDHPAYSTHNPTEHGGQGGHPIYMMHLHTEHGQAGPANLRHTSVLSCGGGHAVLAHPIQDPTIYDSSAGPHRQEWVPSIWGTCWVRTLGSLQLLLRLGIPYLP